MGSLVFMNCKWRINSHLDPKQVVKFVEEKLKNDAPKLSNSLIGSLFVVKQMWGHLT
jgi:hypothetical protein